MVLYIPAHYPSMIPFEKQCVSLELAKQLKELGVKQESLFWWYAAIGNGSGFPVEYHIEYQGEDGRGGEMVCSAFTVAELGALLPFKVVIGGAVLWLQIVKYELYWTVEYTGVAGTLTNPRVMEGPIKTTSDEIADACAMMLIYLVENKLIAA